MFKYKKRATDETSINDELSLIRKIVLSKNAKNFKKKSTFFTTIAHSVTQRALVEDRLADTTHRAPLGIYSEPLRGSADTLPALHCPSGNNKAPLAQRVTDCQSAFSPEGQIKKRPLDLRSGESPPGSSEVLNTKGLQNKQNLIFTRILPKTKFFLNKIYLKNLAKYTNIFSQSQIEWSSDSEDRLADTTLWGSSGSPEAQRKTTPSGPFLERQLSLPPALRLSDRDAQQPFSPNSEGPLVRVAPSFQTEMEYMPTGAPLGQRAKRETVPTDKRLKREIEGNSFYESPLGITLDQSKTSSKQVMQKFHTEYSKQTEIHLITISLASANRIRQWAEKTLPNGKVVGEVINPETVHYKTLKPIKGGLFCERIFGPLKDHECACGKKFNIKNFLIPPKAAASLSLAAKGPLRKDENTLAPLGISLGQPELLEKYGLKAKSGAQKRYFCRICDVEYTYSIIRRTQLGYIRLATPATHVWFVKGIPSYISILLDIKRKHLQNIIYNSATLTLEHSLRGRQFVPNSPKSIFLSWQKIMQQQYPEKYGKTELNVFQPQKVPLQGNQLPSGLGGVPIHQSNNILPKGRKREGAPKELSGSAFSYPPDQRFALPLNGGQRWNICPRRIGNILPQSGPKGLASPALRDHNVGVREGNERSELLDRYVRVYNEQVILYKQNKKAFYKGTYDPSSLYSYPGGAPFGHILRPATQEEGGPKGQRRKRWHDQEAENTLKVAQRVPSGQRETDPFTQKKGWIRFVQSAAKIYAKGPFWGNDEPLCSLPKEPLWADIPLYYVSRNILPKGAPSGQRRNILHMKEGAKCNITNQTRFYNKIYVSKQHDLTFLCFSLLNIINLTDTRKIYLLNLLNFLSSSISSTFNFYLTNTFFSSQNCLQLYTHSLLKVLTINTKKGYICPKGAQSAESLTPLWASLGKYCFSCGPLYLLCLKSNLINLAICYKDICQRGSKADVGPETYITNKSSIFINPPLQRGTKKRSAMPLAGHLEVAQSVAPEGQYIAATNLINTNLTRFLFFSPSLVFQQVLDTCVNKTWLFYTKSMSQKQRYNQGFRPAGLVPKGQTRYETLLMSTAVKTKMKKRNQKIRLSLLAKSLKNYNLKHLQKQTTKILLMLTLNFRKLEVCLNLNPEGKRLSFSCPPGAKGPSGALTKELPLIADQSKLSILKKFNNLTNQKKIKLICQFDCCSYYFKQYYYLKRFNTSNTLATYYYFLTYPKKQIVQKLYKSLISDFTKIMQNSLISVNVKIVENASLLIQGDLQGNMLLSAFAPMKRVGSKGACMEGPFGYCFKLTKDYSYFKLSYIKQLLSLKTLTCFSLLPQRKDKPESISNFKQSLKINIFKIYAQGGLKLFSYPPGPEGQLPFVVSAIYAQRAESSRCPATPALRHILPKGRRLSSGSFGPHNCPSLSLSLGAKGFAIYREKAGPLESLKEIDIKKVFSETKNFISNNIYCLSHRELWEQEKDWQDFSYYYYSPSNIFDSLIPLYKNRNYDRALQEAPSVSNIYPKGGFQTKKLEKGALPNGRLNENNKVLYTSGMNIDTAFSGAGLIQKLLNEFSYTELKKIDKQNRVLLFEYNKYVKDLKNIIAGDDSQLLLTLQLKGSAINAQRGYYKACHIRDVLIRRTKLTRKIFNKLSPTAQTTGPLGPEGPTSPGGKLIDGLNMILTLLPVLPPVLRPVLKMSGQFTISDLNRLYQRIIYRNERLKKFLKDPALSSSFEMKYAQRLVQEAVDNLIQNGKSGVVPEKDARGRLLKSLSDILKGKQGRFRQYLLGKRVDYSGRSVIVVGPRLKLHECGIPKEMALVLYSPFLIKRILNEKLADTYLSAKKLIRKNPLLVSQLLREIMKECPVLLNRAPTLHRLGFQAFQPKLVDGKAILLHPLVCPAFNADFDGDQMAVHVPITFEARAEAWKLMLARNNLLSPATGEPLILPSQDMVLGCYYLTTNSAPLAQTARAPWAYIAQRGKYKKGYGMYFPTPQDVLKAYNQQLIHVHAVIWVSIKGYVENGNTLEQPLEMRLPLTNYKLNKYKNTKQKTVKNLKYVEIYKKCHNFLNLNSPSAHICLIGSGVPQRAPFGQYMHKGGNILPITECSIIHQIIKTTPGKIVFNIKLKNAMEKRPVLLSKYVTGTGFMKKRLLNTVAQRVTDCPAP